MWAAQVEHARRLGLPYPVFLWWIEEGGGSGLYLRLLQVWAAEAEAHAGAAEAQAAVAAGWQGGRCEPDDAWAYEDRGCLTS